MRTFVVFLLFASTAFADMHHFYNPSWSPDGKRIAFEAQETDTFAIYAIDADGSNLVKLTSGTLDDEQPRWSPDGKHIAFISSRDGHLQIYLMNADGSDQHRVSVSDRIDYQPAFSPDGKRIAFVSRGDQPSMIHEIQVMNVDGSARKRLTDDSKDNSTSPRWRNGKQILFVRHPIIQRNYKDLTPEQRVEVKRSQELMIMNADGSNAHALTSNTAQDCCAAWSRDGKTIYFMSDRDGASHVYAMHADGTEPKMIANGTIVKQPEISPDGKRFAYTRETDGRSGLYVYDLAAESERLLAGH
jgi:TolB protein